MLARGAPPAGLAVSGASTAKYEITCGFFSLNRWKSPCVRPLTAFPFASLTTARTTIRFVRLRIAGLEAVCFPLELKAS